MDIDVWLVERAAAHAALREALAPRLGVAPAEVVLRTAPDGRPYVEGDVGFSLSHTRSLAAIAVADGAVGIDVEAVCPPEQAARVARGFPPDEARALAALEGPELVQRFLAHWTAKEAVAKAAGMPLLRAVREVELDAAGQRLLRDGWTLRLLSLIPSRVALAVAAPVADARVRSIAALPAAPRAPQGAAPAG